MPDLSLQFGGDLSIGPTGDLLLCDGTTLTQQRVLRRLLTNLGDYIWQISYGAGLGQYVGQPGNSSAISGLVKKQMLLENSVSVTPVPSVVVSTHTDGTMNLSLSYTDVTAGETSVLTFSI